MAVTAFCWSGICWLRPQHHLYNTHNIYVYLYMCLFIHCTNNGASIVDMRFVVLKCSPPPSPVSVVWSLDFGSLHFSHTALTGASPAEQDQPGNPGAASEWLSGPAQHTHTIVIRATHKQQHVLLLPCYLSALQLLFAEGMLFLQRLMLDLHTDELSLHLSTLILQLQNKKET